LAAVSPLGAFGAEVGVGPIAVGVGVVEVGVAAPHVPWAPYKQPGVGHEELLPYKKMPEQPGHHEELDVNA
jgi:hypothetical protein